VDILVDLSLHMAHNRLLVFARKPRRCSEYLGYCGTTGLETMDYRFSDPHLDPPYSDVSNYVEQTFDCGELLVYQPREAPDISAGADAQQWFRDIRLPE